jgi:hypothetical protein
LKSTGYWPSTSYSLFIQRLCELLLLSALEYTDKNKDSSDLTFGSAPVNWVIAIWNAAFTITSRTLSCLATTLSWMLP